MADRSESGGSRAAVVGGLVREAILAGRLEPGSRLTFPDLCKTYDVSVGVLREALTHLVDRGVVHATTNLGFRVMDLSDSNFAGLAAVRAAAEPRFLRQAVLNATMQWEADVVASHHLLTRTPLRDADGRLSSGWLEAHEAFHVALVSGADNYRMIDISARLRDEADLYARWWLSPDQLERMEEPMAAEHAELVEAVLARNAGLGESLLEKHITDGALLIAESQRIPT